MDQKVSMDDLKEIFGIGSDEHPGELAYLEIARGVTDKKNVVYYAYLDEPKVSAICRLVSLDYLLFDKYREESAYDEPFIKYITNLYMQLTRSIGGEGIKGATHMVAGAKEVSRQSMRDKIFRRGNE